LAGDSAESDASIAHDQALANGNEGNLEAALPLFKRATELNPKDDTYWSNYGVTLMRLSYLDEALVAYTRALRLKPTSELAKANMGALQQIIAERSKAIPTSGRAEIAEKKSMPPQRPSRTSSAEPSRPRGQSQTPPPRQHRGESDELDDWLGPWWQDREKLAPQFKDALTNFRPIQIRNFLKYDKAIALHDELYASDSWDVYESFNRYVVESFLCQMRMRTTTTTPCN